MKCVLFNFCKFLLYHIGKGGVDNFPFAVTVSVSW